MCCCLCNLLVHLLVLPCANPCRLFFERQLDKFVIRFGFLIHTYVCTHVQCVAPWINNVELGVKYLIYMYVPVESCCKVPFKFSKGETATCLGLKRIQELMMCSFICSWWKETRSGFAGAVGVEYKGIFIEKAGTSLSSYRVLHTVLNLLVPRPCQTQ